MLTVLHAAAVRRQDVGYKVSANSGVGISAGTPSERLEVEVAQGSGTMAFAKGVVLRT